MPLNAKEIDQSLEKSLHLYLAELDFQCVRCMIAMQQYSKLVDTLQAAANDRSATHLALRRQPFVDVVEARLHRHLPLPLVDTIDSQRRLVIKGFFEVSTCAFPATLIPEMETMKLRASVAGRSHGGR